MRLTLRTMLAYLDDILDASDADELSQKIEESTFASDLVHRIRNSTRRLRLGAPKPEGKGMGLDANTVAEYLESKLPAEHVPDFEKVCLESDAHLAEVASCHQILTLVNSEPAGIEQAIRERIYGVSASTMPPDPLSQESAVPHLATALVADAKSGRSADAHIRTPTGGRSSRRAAKSIAITLVLAFVLALVGFRAMGEFNSSHPVWRLVAAGSRQVADSPPGESGSQDEAERSPASADPSTDLSTTGALAPNSVVVETTSPPLAGDAVVTPELTGSASRAIGSEAVAGSVAVTPTPGTPTPGSEIVPAPRSEVAPRPTGTGPTTGDSTHVGRYLSEDQLLARFDPGAEVWLRLSADAALSVGDELIVLPTYRPQLLVESGLKVTFVGSAHVKMEEPTGHGLPRLTMRRGRALIVPASDESAAIALTVGDRETTLKLMDMGSSAAVEVQQYLPPGADPETTPAELVVRVYGITGQTSWEENGSDSQLVNSGELLTVLGSEGPMIQPVDRTPAWIESGDVKPIERRASQELRELVTTDRPMIMSLMEQTEPARQRRVEVRSLANRSLVLFGIYDSSLKTLADKRHRSYWKDHFTLLRSALAEGSEASAKLQRQVEMAHRAEAATVFRLIRGYSPDQLAAGAAEELVQLLEHSEMTVRVLAYLNLEVITGRTHLFLPSKEPGQDRRGTVAAWRRSLEDGRIVYRNLPSPLPERLAAGKRDTVVP
jgi:hypothetical protein